MRFLRIFLALAMSVTAVAQEPYQVRSTVTGCVNVRADSSTSSAPRDCLVANTAVTVLSSRPYWREIEYPGSVPPSWIAKKYIVPAQTTPTIPTSALNMWMNVHFVDVGQGDAIWIHTADDNNDMNGRFQGRNIIVDGGPYSSDANNALLSYLQGNAHHGAVIDAMVLSHPHSDHYAKLRFVRQMR